MFRSKIRKANGSILPMMAVMILPLLVIMGFAIDIGLVLNSKNQQALIVEHAALSALSQYVKSIALAGDKASLPDNVVVIVDSAKKRAAAVARTNVTIIDKNLSDTANRIADQGSDISEKKGTSGGTAPPIGELEEATIEFGRYFFIDEDINPMAKSLGTFCKGKVPCFVPGDSKDVANNNAIRFTMQVTKANPIHTYFLNLIGIGGVHHKAAAIATLIPRNDIFLLDLSPSVYYGNYHDRNIKKADGTTDEPGTKSAFSFPFRTGDGTPGKVTVTERCLEGEDPSTINPNTHRCKVVLPAPDNRDDPVFQETWHDMKFNANELYCDGPGEPVCPVGYKANFKFRQDFRIVKVRFDRKTGSAGDIYDEEFLVHSVDPNEPPSSPFPKPEPLTSILRAVHKGMEILKDRALSTDHLGIFGFDSDRDADKTMTEEGRVVTESPRYFDMIVPSLTTPPFDVFFSATNYKDPVDFANLTKLALFPRFARDSDLHAAIFMALQKINASPTYKFAKNSIFMFTDGLGNCPHKFKSVGGSSSEYEIPFTHSELMNEDGEPEDYACMPNTKYILETIKGINDPNFIKALNDRNISLSIAMVGANSGAHYIVQKSYSRNGCMDNIEAAKYNYANFIESNFDYDVDYSSNAGKQYLLLQDLFLKSGGNYYIPNELYKIVNATKGLWIPILPPLLDSSGTPINFNDLLEGACASINPAASGHDQRIVVKFKVNGVKVTDDEGRILYDPHGRTPEKQMQDAMTTVLQSPFVLAQ
jgi:hypothetical protein